MNPQQRKHTAIVELKNRGLVPPHCVDGSQYSRNPTFYAEDEDGNPIMIWTEPIPGLDRRDTMGCTR
jgi:hypothetical protein